MEKKGCEWVFPKRKRSIKSFIYISVVLFAAVLFNPLGVLSSSARELRVEASVDWSCGTTQTPKECKEAAKKAALKEALQNYKVHIRSFQKVENFGLTDDVLSTLSGGYIYKAKFSKKNLSVDRFTMEVIGYVISEEIDFYIEKLLQERNAGSCPSGMSFIPYSEPFCIDLYEYPNKLGQKPRNKVSWYKAKELCESQGKYLCSEGEWQAACQGPRMMAYPYGDNYDSSKCRTGKGKKSGPDPSGDYRFCKSGYDVYDMSGNLREWTSSDYDSSGVKKVLRGGDWSNNANYSHCRHRHHYPPDDAYSNFGFRCCGKPGK